MDTPIVKELARWTDGFFKTIGLNPKSQTISAPAAVVAPVRPVFSNLLLAPTSRHFVRSAGLSGTLAIFLGVYGAHAMRENTPEELKRLFQMAQNYHLLHSAVLLALPLVSQPKLTGSLFIGGLTLFCGPMYYHAIRGDARYRPVTPYGGLLLLAGWISIFVL